MCMYIDIYIYVYVHIYVSLSRRRRRALAACPFCISCFTPDLMIGCLIRASFLFTRDLSARFEC